MFLCKNNGVVGLFSIYLFSIYEFDRLSNIFQPSFTEQKYLDLIQTRHRFRPAHIETKYMASTIFA